jgi:lysophospholipase L1-like esterase
MISLPPSPYRAPVLSKISKSPSIFREPLSFTVIFVLAIRFQFKIEIRHLHPFKSGCFNFKQFRMKKTFLIPILISTYISLSFMSGKKIKVIFFGDSITQAAVQPHGFITIDEKLLNTGDVSNYELIGAGISGNKVYDLYLRMEEDVISLSPDIVVIWVGVNDVWHKKSSGTGTDADKFEKFYLALVRKFKAAHIKIIACTPATIGEKQDGTNEQDGDMDKYSDIIRKIAADQRLTLVDMRKSFIDYEKQNNKNNGEKGILTADGVHLNEAGNIFVAGLMAEGIRNTH